MTDHQDSGDHDDQGDTPVPGSGQTAPATETLSAESPTAGTPTIQTPTTERPTAEAATSDGTGAPATAATEPAARDWRRYLASVPERTTRAGTALAAGTLYEVSQVALPRVVRGSKLYQATVARLLRIAVEGVGGVSGVYPVDGISARELTVRKAAGNAVEFASIAAVGFSPLWLLAAASDLTGGSKAYLRVLVDELERVGLLQPNTDVSSYDDLLTRLEVGSGVLADTVDVPPLNVADLRTSWGELRRQASDLPGPDGLATIFTQLQETAQREEQSLWDVSSAVALGAARAGMQLGNTHVFDYYRDALRRIADEGLLDFLRRTSTPYGKRAWRHFSPSAPTYTERGLEWLERRRAARSAPPGE